MTSKRLFLLAAAGLLAASAMAATRVFRPARETMGSTNLIPVQEIDGADWI